jgi:hypothetical protein
MKGILYLLLLFLLVFLTGCKKDDPVSTGSGGLDITGGGGVTFTISQRQGNQGGIMFTAKPSTAVTVTQITVSLPAQNFNDILQGDGTTVFQGSQTYDLEEYTGVASGQQWTFKFEGKLGSAQGQAYSVTSNYTVP